MNKADKQRLDDLHNVPCVCCLEMRVAQPLPTEANHDVSKGYRKHSGGHQATNSLCSWHHRAIPVPGLTQREMYEIYGPSMKYQGPPETVFMNKGAFERCFGTQAELTAKSTALLTSA